MRVYESAANVLIYRAERWPSMPLRLSAARPPRTRRGPVAGLLLALALPALAGCIASPEPLPSADAAPATSSVASPMGPFLAGFPEGADTVLFAIPLPEEARIADEDTGETRAALALDARASAASGAEVPTVGLLLHAVLWTRAGVSLGSAILVPHAGMVVEGDPGWELVQGASVSFTLPAGDLDEVLVAAILRGSAVAEASVAAAWLDAVPDDGDPLGADAAREAVVARGAPAPVPILESGSGGHFATALDAPGGSSYYGLDHERSALVAQAGVEADARVATTYRFDQGHAKGGYQADAAVALFYTGPLDWRYGYKGAVEARGGSTDLNTGQPLLDLVVYGLQGYFGVGAVPPGTRIAASYDEHLVAGSRFLFIEVHSAFPVPLADHTEADPYALIDCSGPGEVLNDCEPLLVAGGPTIIGAVVRQTAQR